MDSHRSVRLQKKKTILKEFYENSTLHGLRNIFASEYMVFRALWLVLVLLAFFWLLYSSVISFTRYFEYPTLVYIEETIKTPLPFPTVTICSNNFADKFKIFAKDNDSEFRKYRLNISACAATANIRGGRPCGHALVCTFVGGFVGLGATINNCSEDYQNDIKQALSKSNVTFNLMEFLETFGESWDEVLRVCMVGQYNETSCTDKRFFNKTIKSYGLCHQFNGEGMTFVSTSSGSLSGIFFLLESRVDRYFYPKFSEGFNVYLHEKGSGMGGHEISTAPGMFTSIAVSQEKLQYLPKTEGGKCERRSLRGYTVYTQDDCLVECIDNFIEAKCGCRLNFSPQISPKDCHCPLACNVTKYKTSVSYGLMPRKSATGVMEMVPFPNYSQDNFLIISVFFVSHRELLFQERRSFDLNSLFGEIGGNMGLLLGCSAITLTEFVFLFVSLVISHFSREGQVRDDQCVSNQ